MIPNLKYANKFIDRFKGLMFKKDITPICFPRCKSIHTFFMKKNIDVIISDKNNKVIAIYKNVGKNKIIINKKAYYIYELPINTYHFEINDIIK